MSVARLLRCINRSSCRPHSLPAPFHNLRQHTRPNKDTLTRGLMITASVRGRLFRSFAPMFIPMCCMTQQPMLTVVCPGPVCAACDVWTQESGTGGAWGQRTAAAGRGANTCQPGRWHQLVLADSFKTSHSTTLFSHAEQACEGGRCRAARARQRRRLCAVRHPWQRPASRAAGAAGALLFSDCHAPLCKLACTRRNAKEWVVFRRLRRPLTF